MIVTVDISIEEPYIVAAWNKETSTYVDWYSKVKDQDFQEIPYNEYSNTKVLGCMPLELL